MTFTAHLRLRRDGDPVRLPGRPRARQLARLRAVRRPTRAATFDLSRPGEIGYIDRAVSGRTAGYRTVPIGPAHPYLTGGLPMDFPGVGYGQNDLFAFQARAFLEQVAGAGACRRCRPSSTGCTTCGCSPPSPSPPPRVGAEIKALTRSEREP